MGKKVSIIIPVYNTLRYLEKCLSSVAAQSFEDWECIVIDDGSTDGSGEICEKWCGIDKRFRVYHNTNHGVAAARNYGIKQAVGEYVTFIDSDDYVDADYLEHLIAAVSSSAADLTVCGFVCEFKNCSKEYVHPDSGIIQLTSDDSLLFSVLLSRRLLFSPFCKLYRRELIEDSGSLFDERFSYGEDLMFNLAYLRRIDKIMCVQACPYHYRKAMDSTLSSAFRENRFQVDYLQWKEICSFLSDRDLMCDAARTYLSQRLWGSVYDGIFQFPQLAVRRLDYFRGILSIPEIDSLTGSASDFGGAPWIKRAILRRDAIFFYIYFKFVHRK